MNRTYESSLLNKFLEFNQMSRIVVSGGSRGIGLETVKTLLHRGHHLTLFSRGGRKVNLSDPNLGLFPGDALDDADVNAAIEAKDVVVQTLGVPANLRLLSEPIDLFSSATRTLIGAMETKKLLGVY